MIIGAIVIVSLMGLVCGLFESKRRSAASDAEFHAEVRLRMAEWRRLNLSPADDLRHAVALHRTEIAVQKITGKRPRTIWAIRLRKRLLKRTPARYDVRREYDQTWTVYDIFTGLPYELEDHYATGLQEQSAQGLKTVLNRAYERRLKAGLEHID